MVKNSVTAIAKKKKEVSIFLPPVRIYYYTLFIQKCYLEVITVTKKLNFN